MIDATQVYTAGLMTHWIRTITGNTPIKVVGDGKIMELSGVRVVDGVLYIYGDAKKKAEKKPEVKAEKPRRRRRAKAEGADA